MKSNKMKLEDTIRHGDHDDHHHDEVPQDSLAVREPELYNIIENKMVSNGTYAGG